MRCRLVMVFCFCVPRDTDVAVLRFGGVVLSFQATQIARPLLPWVKTPLLRTAHVPPSLPSL